MFIRVHSWPTKRCSDGPNPVFEHCRLHPGPFSSSPRERVYTSVFAKRTQEALCFQSPNFVFVIRVHTCSFVAQKYVRKNRNRTGTPHKACGFDDRTPPTMNMTSRSRFYRTNPKGPLLSVVESRFRLFVFISVHSCEESIPEKEHALEDRVCQVDFCKTNPIPKTDIPSWALRTATIPLSTAYPLKRGVPQLAYPRSRTECPTDATMRLRSIFRAPSQPTPP